MAPSHSYQRAAPASPIPAFPFALQAPANSTSSTESGINTTLIAVVAAIFLFAFVATGFCAFTLARSRKQRDSTRIDGLPQFVESNGDCVLTAIKTENIIHTEDVTCSVDLESKIDEASVQDRQSMTHASALPTLDGLTAKSMRKIEGTGPDVEGTDKQQEANVRTVRQTTNCAHSASVQAKPSTHAHFHAQHDPVNTHVLEADLFAKVRCIDVLSAASNQVAEAPFNGMAAPSSDAAAATNFEEETSTISISGTHEVKDITKDRLITLSGDSFIDQGNAEQRVLSQEVGLIAEGRGVPNYQKGVVEQQKLSQGSRLSDECLSAADTRELDTKLPSSECPCVEVLTDDKINNGRSGSITTSRLGDVQFGTNSESDSSSSLDSFCIENDLRTGLATWGLSEAMKATDDLQNLLATGFGYDSESEPDDGDEVDIAPKPGSALSSLPLCSISSLTPVVADVSELFDELQAPDSAWLDYTIAESGTTEAVDALPSTEQFTSPRNSRPLLPVTEAEADPLSPLTWVASFATSAIGIYELDATQPAFLSHKSGLAEDVEDKIKAETSALPTSSHAAVSLPPALNRLTSLPCLTDLRSIADDMHKLDNEIAGSSMSVVVESANELSAPVFQSFKSVVLLTPPNTIISPLSFGADSLTSMPCMADLASVADDVYEFDTAQPTSKSLAPIVEEDEESEYADISSASGTPSFYNETLLTPPHTPSTLSPPGGFFSSSPCVVDLASVANGIGERNKQSFAAVAEVDEDSESEAPDYSNVSSASVYSLFVPLPPSTPPALFVHTPPLTPPQTPALKLNDSLVSADVLEASFTYMTDPIDSPPPTPKLLSESWTPRGPQLKITVHVKARGLDMPGVGSTTTGDDDVDIFVITTYASCSLERLREGVNAQLGGDAEIEALVMTAAGYEAFVPLNTEDFCAYWMKECVRAGGFGEIECWRPRYEPW